jgi:hypothetical protein
MSETINRHSISKSDASSSHDVSRERQQEDQVVFENVADQYVKGEDVTSYFTILNDTKANPSEDQIGLLRVCHSFRLLISFLILNLGWLYKYSRMFIICTYSIYNTIRINSLWYSSISYIIFTSNR